MLKEAKKVPAIRFSGFTDSWEQRKLNEVLDLLKDGTHGTHQDADEGPLLLSAKNIKNGEIVWDDSDRRISIEEYKSIHSNFQLQPDDILLTIVGSIGETAILRNPQGLTFQRSVAFLRPNKHINSEFMCSEIQSTRFQNELRKRKSTSAQSGIYLGDLQEIPFIFPANPDEQRNISSCFYNLDNLIALHQRKLNQQKKLKKYFLQNMFPAKGEKVPRIRFKEFTGDWEQKKIIDVCDYVDYRGKTPTKTNSGIFLVTAKNIKDGYIDYDVSREYVSKNDYDEVMHRGKPRIGDVLITTEAPCGNVAQVNKENIALAQRIIKYRGHDNVIDNTYLKYYLLSPEFQNVLYAKSSGGTVQGIKGSILHQQKVNFPSYEEQLKIGQYFDDLDNLITLQHRRLDQLQTMKQFMLQNMFI